MIIFPGVQALDVSGPLDAFAEANVFIADDDGYRVTLIGPEREPFRASNGMLLAPDLTYEEAEPGFQLVLVAGGPGLPEAAPDPRLAACLHAIVGAAARYGSICTGAFALGHAGLLDGRMVTTHWQNAPVLARMFPEANVDFDRIYIRDGALLTSAGVTAGIDLALSIINEDHGSAVALAVAKRLVVVAQRQGGQSQFSPYISAPSEESSPIAKVYQHVMAHLRDRLSVADLAERAGMSPRNFARAFAQQVQATPAEFVEQARVDAARNLLEGSDLALKAIAFECGFGNVQRMRLVFAKRLGVTPNQYRASFRRD
ncbi:GlxA family transcriptional regulator [Rhizobium jaguaris]